MSLLNLSCHIVMAYFELTCYRIFLDMYTGDRMV